MIRIYGIPNCDTMKKAFNWLNTHSIPFEFHDYKKQGLASTTLHAWIEELGIDQVINKRGTTWKKLDPAIQQKIESRSGDYFNEIIANLSVIRRPVIEYKGKTLLGFDENRYQEELS